MKATLILQKQGKKYGYVLAAKAGMSKGRFISLLHKVVEGYEIILLNIK